MALRTGPRIKWQEKPAQNRLHEAPFRTETQKGVFVMKYDAKEFKKYPEAKEYGIVDEVLEHRS